ncbi:MAG: SNF2-related protein [Acidimicrobiia bacterium]
MAQGLGDSPQGDLFSADAAVPLRHVLDGLAWPPTGRFPVNRASASVRSVVWADLVSSRRPRVVTGYASIDQLIQLIADWRAQPEAEQLQIVLGSEPFPTTRRSFGSPRVRFTEEVEAYWLDRGIRVDLSAKVLAALDAIRTGQVAIRAVTGDTALHAKVYVGDAAATTGSSNFTAAGLGRQLEVNARFVRAERADTKRYDELTTIADNLWQVAEDWSAELVALLEQLLRLVGWREALAMACRDVLEGDWAQQYLRQSGDLDRLLPSQVAGIAQAMWIIETVGSVLVADATGSGKTRMGAHLTRAVRDRLWATGRVRRDLTVLVCPPAVQDTWRAEASRCGLNLSTISHGRLSRSGTSASILDSEEVQRAQLLAVDEAHNFLNPDSKRTRHLRRNVADHVLLFTATPINKDASDLLDLVALLGPDSFEDSTLVLLDRMVRWGWREAATVEDVERLRAEIQRFTLRRTKPQINALVDREPEAYRHPETGRVCRYPSHRPLTYPTGETEADDAAANEIRHLAAGLSGISLLPARIAVPRGLRRRVSPEAWLQFRLRSAAGLAGHHVLAALRSSRAALHEHLHGTTAATEAFDIPAGFKASDTGDQLQRITDRLTAGPPEVNLDCEVPDWLLDAEAWEARCREELERYQAIATALHAVSDARERTKVALLQELASRHARVLAFDRHLITLSVLQQLHGEAAPQVLIATGQGGSDRNRVISLFAPTGTERGIALCSDAMNEGLNLQGASAIVHLDLPTTLRVAEQRVGRVDRMDSPHDTIEAWWPRDGHAFATRANERLLRRAEESEALLGANLQIPNLSEAPIADEREVDVTEVQREVQALLDRPADHLADALAPVHDLVTGPTALVSEADYQAAGPAPTAGARLAPVAATSPWAFLAVRSTVHGAPRWMHLDLSDGSCVTDLPTVAQRLRTELGAAPQDRPLDDAALAVLERATALAAAKETELLPRRHRRALDQMGTVLAHWALRASSEGDELGALRWRSMAELLKPDPDHDHPDLAAVAERWLDLIGPAMEAARERTRHRSYATIQAATATLMNDPLELTQVEEALATVPTASPLIERVSICILGVT